MFSRDYLPNNDTVWCKGERCLSPYSGDNRLYKGVITKLCRSTAGHVTAVVQFDGYNQDESEEVDITRLQKVPVRDKGMTSPCKKQPSSPDMSLFKPLQGDEFHERLRAKYDEDEDEVVIKSEKLSDIILGEASGQKPLTNAKQALQKNKSPVATGCLALQGKRKRGVAQKNSMKCSVPASPRRRHQLEISGGQAIDKLKQKEKKRSPRVSDISCVVDPSQINSAFLKHRMQLCQTGPEENNLTEDQFKLGTGSDNKYENQTKNKTRNPFDIVNQDKSLVLDSKQEPVNCQEIDTGSKTQAIGDAEDFDYNDGRFQRSENFTSGFDDHDMEKPQFGLTADSTKVPYQLSPEGESPVVQVPAPLNQYLRDYQREGIQFLYNHYKHNQGAILGDDMGLGKTVQVIGFLSALLGKQGNRVDVMRQKPSFIRQMSGTSYDVSEGVSRGPFLIIGPGCVLYNWLEELETWGYFTVRKFHGSDKSECIADIKKGKLEIVVTTYETFREHQETLNGISWNAVIVDEVHKIKDINSQITRALRTINTGRRYGLTGTALQNNLLELWSILDWAKPGCLGTRHDFEAEYVQPIELGQRHDANKRELALARTKKEKFADIRKGMMIRRMKSLIADQLPKKDDNVVFCRLSQLQISLYHTILEHPDMALVLHMGDPCPCDSGLIQSKCCFKKTKDGQSVKSLMFTFLHLLLKVSNHVALLIPTARTSDNQVQHARRICEAALGDHPQFVQQTKEASFKTLSDPKYCGKMKILQGLLRVFSKEHNKILIFSYSTQVLDIIEQYLMGTGFEYRRIDGSVTAKKRLVIVREFNSDPSIFICLISTKAGGLGLNLTGANKVVIFDPNWNPTHDLQAQDRAYRIGQRRNVAVYRLVSAGTIEENMYLRQIYKQQLLNVTVEDENARRYFYAVQGNARQKGELFGIKNMFKLRTGDSCLTMDILKRNDRVESALSNFDIAEYISPEIKVEEEEEEEITGCLDNKDVIGSSEEDLFAQFFTSQDLTIDTDATPSEKAKVEDNQICHKQTKKICASPKASPKRKCIDSDSQGDVDQEDDTKTGTRFDKKKKAQKTVRFKSPQTHEKVSCRSGKVLPSNSATGKCPVRRSKRVHELSDSEEDEEKSVLVDQTLAGTFQDVEDVFETCGVVHIHENMKVVGGSRAEDHMTRCAITDVFELHQNSQELAVQCEQMQQSESEEDSPVKPLLRRQRQPNADHNTPRSITVDGAKVLIGQTPVGIKQKQVEEMCKFHKCSSMVDFAELVLSSSLQKRMSILNSYYGNQIPKLGNIHQIIKPEQRTGQLYKQKERQPRKKITLAKVKSKRRAESVSFLKDPASFTESEESQQGHRTQGMEEEEEEVSSMEVGCEMSTSRRKRLLKKNIFPARNSVRPKQHLHRESKKSVYAQHDSDVDSGTNVGDTSRDNDNEQGKIGHLTGIESSESVDDLLRQMGAASENLPENSNVYDTLDGSVGSISTNKKSKGNKTNQTLDDCLYLAFTANNFNSTKFPQKDIQQQLKVADTSVIDELFGDSEAIKKPAPSRHNIKSEDNRERKEREAFADSGQLIDDIFIASSVGNDAGEEKEEDREMGPGLEVNTLKNSSLDVFDDPQLWKRRKRKPTERKNAVDQLIQESDANYDRLFSTGKLRKIQKDRTNSNSSDNGPTDQEPAIGTPSLFSF